MTKAHTHIKDLIDGLVDPDKANLEDLYYYERLDGMIFMAWFCDQITVEQRTALRRALNDKYNLTGFPL